MFSKLLVLVSVVYLLLPLAAGAEEPTASKVPEFNPLCWKAEQCCQLRAQISRQDAGACEQLVKSGKEIDGWVQEDPCTGDWGKCLPAGETKTTIAFGGERKFANLGVFIQKMYRYAIGIAGILAVVMIIVAGFQWVTSGGNAETITSAKHRIAGALMGAFLAYVSFFILNTLNPALVQLRLPRVWMTRPQNIIPEYCSQVPKGTLLAWVADPSNQAKPLQLTGKETFDLTVDNSNNNSAWKQSTFDCGNRFFVKDGGTATCFGDFCKQQGGKRAHCVKNFSADKYECQAGEIFITVTHNSFAKTFSPDWLTEEWDDPPVESGSYLVAQCKDGSVIETAIVDEPPRTGRDGKTQQVVINLRDITDLDKHAEECQKEKGGFKGFAVVLAMNESNDLTSEFHYISKGGIDMGDIGRLNQGFIDIYVKKIPDKFFFSADDIKKGLRLHVEAATIKDIDDDDKDWGTYFARFNIQRQ